MPIDREKMKRKAMEAIDQAADEELERGVRDQDYAHDWLQSVIGFIAGLMEVVVEIFRGCHISTALVNYLGFDNNCKELEILRQFRDVYIVASGVEERLRDLNHYYCYAPQLIDWIEARADAPKIWRRIHTTVNTALADIAEGRYDDAYKVYKTDILDLKLSIVLQD